MLRDKYFFFLYDHVINYPPSYRIDYILNDKPGTEMDRLKSLLCRLCRIPRQHIRPQQDAELLQMPIEIILLIASHLPRQSLYTLAQSCNPMNVILRHYFRFGDSDVPQHRSEALDITGCLSKEVSDRLFCDKCIDFHVAAHKRLPRGPWREYQLNTMTRGCKRQKICGQRCCHPPHLCSCYRSRSMTYIPKQHIELVLSYNNPSLVVGDWLEPDDMLISPLRLYYPSTCKLRCSPVPFRPSTTVHYTIMARIIQGRFLLYREIRWTNARSLDLDLSVLHTHYCLAGVCQGMMGLELSILGLRDRILFDTARGKPLKCSLCLSEYIFQGTRRDGMVLLWQDLGSADDPRHHCPMDMLVDVDRAQREVASIAKLFGPL